ncbi:kelch repeat-containing protein [Natronomonas gomsonensis]|uniref:kelch repeat-containing protein n=1 Tax=Natronomonas gomsonensis TaxID=1046043 RepID=UPI0015B7FE80|nr:kelch repeat-containing protein [Natronomonas gomsonensis]
MTRSIGAGAPEPTGSGVTVETAIEGEVSQWAVNTVTTATPDTKTAQLNESIAEADGYVYMVGGNNYFKDGDGAVSEAHRWDVENGGWEQIAPLPAPRQAGRLFVDDGTDIYYAGGDSAGIQNVDGSTIHADVWRYNRYEDEWVSVAPLPEPLYDPGGGTPSNSVSDGVLLWGETTDGSGNLVNNTSVYLYDAGADSWSTASATWGGEATDSSTSYATSVYTDRIYKLGPDSGVKAYDAESDSFVDLNADGFGYDPRAIHYTQATGGNKLVTVPQDGSTGADMYDIESDTFESIEPVAPTRPSGQTTASNKNWIGGGYIDEGYPDYIPAADLYRFGRSELYTADSEGMVHIYDRGDESVELLNLMTAESGESVYVRSGDSVSVTGSAFSFSAYFVGE